ncbi:MAG: hypothetical protein ACTSR2_02875, partial [Candidatus Hodarchaeales archaeon]
LLANDILLIIAFKTNKQKNRNEPVCFFPMLFLKEISGIYLYLLRKLFLTLPPSGIHAIWRGLFFLGLGQEVPTQEKGFFPFPRKKVKLV